MTRLATFLLGGAAAVRGVAAFVAPPSSGPASPPPRLRQAAFGEVPGVAGESLLPPAAGASSEQGPSPLKWLGAGLAAGLILA
eukprot:CAMPEP_0197889364 /NCGR_PEP_ID=MMETSP1439-20131203/24305_1 /TAXON_ID=66791 /ORGANISM="Gonyaulax spinifera, Strain CCMP409" /LENGTH=82 /DNA_ID=CAMNT_0043509341 /DNA_START=43 /DNA_END=287 /DNA_ORIENTATION=-